MNQNIAKNKKGEGRAGVDYVGVTTSFYCHDGEGNFVFALRNKNCRDEHGRWDPGAGGLDVENTLEENVLKEVMEEYGCRGIVEEWLPPITLFREHEGQKTHWLAIGAFVRVNREDVKIMETHKFDNLIWRSLSDLPEPLHSGFQYHFNEQFDIFKKYFPKEN
jgi:8-oxo-dGTP pyrophosphatase MutT (NUDIX family)